MAAKIPFDNTEIAFKYKSTAALQNARFLFQLFRFPWFVANGPLIASWSMGKGLPVKGLIKKFGFNHFCGGETIQECDAMAATLNRYGVGSILDYSVEGEENSAVFDQNTEMILQTIQKAKNNPIYPFAVFKTTGIVLLSVLEKSDAGVALSDYEQAEFNQAKARFEKLCRSAAENKVRLFVDAEESWIQETIDRWTEEMMEKYNKETAIVFNTLQMYRHDRLTYLETQIARAREKGYFAGFKLVRGAYMEKERERALEKGYPSPIQPNKEATDRDYNEALKLCATNADITFLCAGTHNEDSSQLLADILQEAGLPKNDPRFWFAQLFGMSDHISFNLAAEGYHVAKYLPYGPVKSVLPYLSRRAQENTSVKGQMGRELKLVEQELKRRAVR
jgi:proline dehydrogenase